MCLYPTLIKNRKYTDTAKNGGVIPVVNDVRTLYVPVGCGKCMECRKQKARGWQVRLLEDIKEHKNGKFITLTFNDKQLKNLREEVPEQLQGYDIDNWIAAKAVRRFLERWRKQYKKSVRHWLVTELGQNNTERIHLHGIIWTNEKVDEIEKHWQYGWVWKGKYTNKKKDLINYVNAQTVNYIVKYISKTDEKHPTYKSIVLTSKGIGANYIKSFNSQANKYNGEKTKETYKTSTGHKIAIPIYYRNKIYNDEQKEQLWINRLNKEERWVNGEKVSVKDNNTEQYWKLIEWHRKQNTQLGYGSNHMTYDQKQYETNRRDMLRKEKQDKANTRICKPTHAPIPHEME